MKPGQKLVCIDGYFVPVVRAVYQQIPKFGQIYTIRDIRPFNAEGGILFNELHNKPVYLPHYQGFIEPAFNAGRFCLCGKDCFEEDLVELDIKRRHIIQYT